MVKISQEHNCISLRVWKFRDSLFISLYIQAFRALWSNERLLNVVEQLIGPDIAGHPVWNLRTKTPQNEATTVPWHQGTQCILVKKTELHRMDGWMAGWMICDFTSFSTVFQSYQDDGRMVLKDCVQWNPVYG